MFTPLFTEDGPQGIKFMVFFKPLGENDNNQCFCTHFEVFQSDFRGPLKSEWSKYL